MIVFWKSLAAEVDAAGAEPAPAAAAPAHRRAGSLRLALAFRDGHDFAGVDVDEPRTQPDDRLALLLSEAADADAAESAADAADAGVLRVVAELGDAADDDRVDAEQPADLRGGVRVGAVAVREVLLGENLVERLALDDRVGAVFDEIGHEQVCDALPHIDSEPK